MKVSKFYSLKDIRGNSSEFHRKKGIFCKRGVYFWGFSLREDGKLPETKDELVIYYIGKDGKNVVRRIMEEVTQLIFGGFGIIIDHNWLIKNPHTARIFDKQESDKKGTLPLATEVLYKSIGLHVLYDFFGNTKIQSTLDWMRERLIFAWIYDDERFDLKPVEKEFHNIVRTNIFGIQHIKNLLPKKDVFIPEETPYFNKHIIWDDNPILRGWFIEVNKKIV